LGLSQGWGSEIFQGPGRAQLLCWEPALLLGLGWAQRLLAQGWG
jgi:hypothetical protein